MGDHIVSKIGDKNRSLFVRQLLDDVKALEIMLQNNLFEKDITRIGAEQEFCLVKDNFRPSLQSQEILTDINDEHFTTELARYNLEINLDPLELKGNCFSKMHQNLDDLLKKGAKSATKFNNKIVLAGILPSITLKELDFEYMTQAERYWTLNEMMKQVRGDNFQLHIKGVNELSLLHDSVLFEACNTSFQLHLQIAPEDFVSSYNWSQAISGPILSIATNSPILLNRELWSETRIALFQQSIDIRKTTTALKNQEPRVAFGTDWQKGTAADIFKNDIARHTFLLTKQFEENSLEMLQHGKIPKLKALNLHNGTVYRWNRACYGVGGGKPHLRIENRYIPAGPSTTDEFANFALWVGLMLARPKEYDTMAYAMDFKDAKGNFIKAARTGIESIMLWDGRAIPAAELIQKEFLPMAYEGLQKANLSKEDIEYYLGIIDKRCSSKTGSQWTVNNYRTLQKIYNKDEALLKITAAMHNNQQGSAAVHEWLDVDSEQHPIESTQVGHIMSPELFTLNENDLAELATSIMQWKNIHHIPVVDNEGKISGLLTWSHMEKYQATALVGNTFKVKDIMEKDVLNTSSETLINDAIDIMTKKDIGCLPVVKDSQPVGIVTVKDLLLYLKD